MTGGLAEKFASLKEAHLFNFTNSPSASALVGFATAE
jgi:hypothetical protein